MSALAEAQRAFMHALFSPQEGEGGMQVYSASVMANYSAALAATYPVVQRLVGEQFFAAVARRFAREHPSTSGDLNDYGAAFAAFLATHPAAASLPYVADVARLEWACHECERAPEAAAFDFEALARVPAHEHGLLRFVLAPPIRRLRSNYPVAAIHAANQPDRDGTPVRTQGADLVLVRRVEGRARVEALEPREWSLLEGIAAGASLASAGAAVGNDAEALGALLARFVADGVICGFART